MEKGPHPSEKPRGIQHFLSIDIENRLLKTAHNSTYLHHVVHQNQRTQQQYDFHRMLNNETMVRVMHRPECILTIKSIHFLLRNTNVI